MIHPHTELRLISAEIGFGVVATRFIPKGTVTWALDRLDREFSADEVSRLPPPYREILNKYCYRNNQGRYVLCWDHGRFVNHSFNSNCLTTAYNMELAIRDIQPGEELTDDYGYLNVTEPFRALDEGRRRKIVYPNDIVKYHGVWDRRLAGAFRHLRRVDQPLRTYIDDDTWQTCLRVSDGTEQMASILNCYYRESTEAPDRPCNGRRASQAA